MSKEVKDNWNTAEERAERKARLKNLNTASGEKKKIRKRVSPLVIAGILVILALLAAALFYTLLQNGWKEKRTTAAIVNGEKVTAQDANFILGNFFQGMTRLPAFSDKGKELLHAVMPMGEKLQPLRDSLMESFEQEVKDTYGFAELAGKEGVTLNEQSKTQIDNYFIQIANAAMQNQMTVGDFTKQLFGPGASEKTVRPVLEKAMLAAQFQSEKLDAIEVTDAELEEEYNANSDEYDTVSFYSFNFNAATPRDKAGEEDDKEEPAKDDTDKKDEKDEAEETEVATPDETEEIADEKTDEAEDPAKLAEELKAKAEDMLKNVKDVESFLKEAKAYATDEEKVRIDEDNALLIENAYKQNLSPSFSEWLFDPARKEGDKEIVENNGTFSVMYFVSRQKDETSTYTSRHILVRVDPEAEDFEAAKEEAKTKAEDILKKYREGEQTEEAFAKLAKEFSDDGGSKDNGGLYEKVVKGNFVKPYEDWCLDPARTEGDVEMVLVESANYSGYHIIYFIGLDDAMWQLAADQAVRAKKFEDYLEDERKNFTYKASEEGLKLVLPADEALLESARESIKEAAGETVVMVDPENSGESENQEESDPTEGKTEEGQKEG